jgi:superfamily II DNA or RNA helicase
MANIDFNPGALVRSRGREWVVEVSPEPSWLCLRPLGGSDEDLQLIKPELESTPVESANFVLPDPENPGSYYSALLLRDALRLKLRAGAGPFRSFGHIALEPRAYQLVPLLMALKQDTIRLLIADDVGIGKTIEAGLILRELLDRGEIRRFAVLCPPHLVDQWQIELEKHFHINAVGLTSSTVSRLERDVPRGISFFEHYKAVVISLDYIKQDTHRKSFIDNAPEMIIVDEAHTCTITGKGRQLRYQMLKGLSQDEERHLVLLTATPHPGKDEAFYNLLSLLRNDFAQLADLTGDAKKTLREELGGYLVQRQRQDIKDWNESGIFPQRMVKEITYKLENEWGNFFEDVRDYCYNLAQKAESERGEQRSVMIWYATLAMLRCASSSPAAAYKALSNRLNGVEDLDALDILMDEHLGDGEELASNDEEPSACIEESQTLTKLIKKADELRGTEKDPKLKALVKHINDIISEKPKPFKPVIFCRYIATAHYVGEHLRKHLETKFPKVVIDVVTGLLSPEERDEKVEQLHNAELPILVATDCLSEGINLQHVFDAVIHYDLAWNPTRHEQREGRVDRYGQEAKEVRCTMIYGQDNPVDGFILNVILKKAQQIKLDLGFMVHLPEDSARIQQALIKAALMKPANGGQASLDFGDDSLSTIESEWHDAQEKAKANRTIFSQRQLKPEDVIPEYKKQEKIIGSEDDVRRFVETSLIYLESPLENNGNNTWFFNPAKLTNAALIQRLEEENHGKRQRIGFKSEQGACFVHRSSPIVSVLADFILEQALEKNNMDILLASRAAVFETKAVDKVTTLYLLRLRHQLDYTRKTDIKKLLAEESLVLATQGRNSTELINGDAFLDSMSAQPSGNISKEVMIRELKTALGWFTDHAEQFERAARNRAAELLADHRRVRDAAKARGQYEVNPCLPIDLIGIYVLLPGEL